MCVFDFFSSFIKREVISTDNSPTSGTFQLPQRFNWRNFYLVAGLIPLLILIKDISTDNLGSNPIQAMHWFLGTWTLRFLWLTLAITPLQRITKWSGLATYRQLFGLYSFFYASLHILGYLWADHNLNWGLIYPDLAESSYLWFGLLAYLILLLLAITSPRAMKKLLGKRWKKLHRWIYLAGIAAVFHYFWQLKGNLIEPLSYMLMLGFLLGFRVLAWLKDKNWQS